MVKRRAGLYVRACDFREWSGVNGMELLASLVWKGRAVDFNGETLEGVRGRGGVWEV